MNQFYLYRAVDRAGKTVDFFLSRQRDINSVKAFLRKAMTKGQFKYANWMGGERCLRRSGGPRWPPDQSRDRHSDCDRDRRNSQFATEPFIAGLRDDSGNDHSGAGAGAFLRRRAVQF